MVGTPRRPSSWLADTPRRFRLESSARAAYPSLHHRRVQLRSPRRGVLHRYTVDLPVPGYPPRHVVVEVRESNPSWVSIYADGPTESPHRYPDRGGTQLCIWHPRDAADRRWVPDDGLLALFGMISHHLLKEAWWRETGEWLGDEYPHGPLNAADDEKNGVTAG